MREESWTCSECGHANPDVRTCERCGVARRWVRDPALDLPPRPALAALPSFWLSGLHGVAALAGALLLLRPETAPWLALHPYVQGVQTVLSAAAFWTTLQKAATERLFHRVALEVPDRVRTGEELPVLGEVVTYGPTSGVHVTIELVENTYQRTERRDPRLPAFGTRRRKPPVTTRSDRLGRHRLLSGGRLRGRRAERFEARFEAPFPNDATRDVQADLLASAYDAFAWLVPGLGDAAENLRNHGGVWARLKVRVGPFTRTVERRVIVWAGAGAGFRIG